MSGRSPARMTITLSCSCGEPITVDESLRGRKVFCAKCRGSVEVPAARPKVEAVKPDESNKEDPGAPSGEISEPRHVERIPAEGALSERWKLTCVCGKRIYSPFHSSQPYGRCPKCGRRMRLPGYKAGSRKAKEAAPERPVPPTPGQPETLADAKLADLITKDAVLKDDLELLPVSAGPSTSKTDRTGSASTTQALGHPEPKPADAGDADEVGTIVMEGPEVEELQRQLSVQRASAVKTADLLRAHRVSDAVRSGIISAWPLAGKLPRALAGFIDLTFCTTAAGVIVALTAAGFLPDTGRHPAVLITAFLTAGLINDILLQLTGGGLGKRLVVLALRRRAGQDVEPPRLIARAILKWLLLPGWLLAFVDPAERALHDLACGTLVLKGRTR